MGAVVYVLVNLVNGKSYIGVTGNLPQRLSQHLKGKVSIIQMAIRKYGWDKFCVAVVDRTKDYDYAVRVLEPLYIKKYRTTDRSRGYNLTSGGQGSLGYIHTEATKETLRNISTGFRHSADTKARMSATHRTRRPRKTKVSGPGRYHMLGKHHSEETKTKTSRSLTGRILSPETRSKIALARTGKRFPRIKSTIEKPTL